MLTTVYDTQLCTPTTVRVRVRVRVRVGVRVGVRVRKEHASRTLAGVRVRIGLELG